MSLFKSFFGKKDTPKEWPANFPQYVQSAIEIWGKQKTEMDEARAIQLLLDNGVDMESAKEILVFLPIAFIHHWLPEVKWQSTYIDFYSENDKRERNLKDNAACQIIWRMTCEYFQKQPNPDVIIRIGGRSAEFHCINDLVRDNPHADLSKILMSSPLVFR